MAHDISPTRTAALDRLHAFVPKAGRAYASNRNRDRGPGGHADVSMLSPYIRHRLVTETEVLQAVLQRHALSSAQKFVQEVYWRTYWKGWLEMRPGVWQQYRAGVRHGLDRIASEGGLRRDWEAACRGETGIDCFDHWAHELAETGYLHNHARMWVASIWIFTLRLPWELGADFFLRHLLDGDPASNTLGWRWVAGLQTPGKNYVARASNIARYTDGRFNPVGQLNEDAAPLDGPPHPPRLSPPMGGRADPGRSTGWLLTEDDLSPGFALPHGTAGPLCTIDNSTARSPLDVAPRVRAFVSGAFDDTLARHANRFGDITRIEDNAAATDTADAVMRWAKAAGVTQIEVPFAPVGPAAETLDRVETRLAAEGISLVRRLRDHDALCWPHATAGFFKFKDKIPRFVAALKGLRAA